MTAQEWYYELSTKLKRQQGGRMQTIYGQEWI